MLFALYLFLTPLKTTKNPCVPVPIAIWISKFKSVFLNPLHQRSSRSSML